MRKISKQTLYPTLGELLNEASSIFDSKPPYTDDANSPYYRVARKIDNLSGYGAFKLDYSMIDQSIDSVFSAPFSNEGDAFMLWLRDCGHAIIGQYVHMIREYALDGFDRQQTVPWLIENHLCKFIHDAINSVQRAHSDSLRGLDLFSNKLPIKTVLDWTEKTFPEFVEFKKDYGKGEGVSWLDVKAERDKVGKWSRGADIPTTDSLWGDKGLLCTFYKMCNIKIEDQTVINEVFFLARGLQVFYRKTAHLKAFENLQKMAKNQYVIRPESYILQDLYEEPVGEVLEQIKTYLFCLEELRELLVNKQTREGGDKEKALNLIQQAEQELEDKAEYNLNWWHLNRFRGRWHELNGETEQAILSYIESVDGFLYSGGEHVRKALRETLTLCCSAYLNGLKKAGSTNLKSYLKRLKAQGRLFEFYPPWQFDEDDVPLEEMKIMASYYWQYFPESQKF